MTYFAFLAWCVGIPLLILALLNWQDYRRGNRLPPSLRGWSATAVVVAHVVVALIYTTPWDNYLVATNVWWYNPKLVTGIVLGWVPIEEYTFFVVQTIMSSLWLHFLARRLPIKLLPAPARGVKIRLFSAGLVALLWLPFVIILAIGWQPGTYLALTLAWALPPVIFQLGFGADILWRYRHLVFWGIAVPTLYLSIGDTFPISAGTWTIDPMQSTGIFIGSLPMEEFVFFLMTNTLIVLGTVLVLAQESHERAPKALVERMRQFVSTTG